MRISRESPGLNPSVPASLQSALSSFVFPLQSPPLACSSVKSLSHVRHFATPWTVAHQAPPSMEFSRQEYSLNAPWKSSSLHWSLPLSTGKICGLSVRESLELMPTLPVTLLPWKCLLDISIHAWAVYARENSSNV